MGEKRPIDRKRESGGMADIGTAEEGAIVDMINIKERLIIVKEKAIYESFTADTVDPGRTNIDLPNIIHKLLVDQGADSELVGKTFLTAKIFFKGHSFKPVDAESSLFIMLELLKELIVLEKEINSYLEEEQKLTTDYESKRGQKVSYAIPTITNLESRCKTIFQKTDHIEQFIMAIVMVFYPADGLTKHSHFPRLYEVIKTKYGEKDLFSQNLSKAVYLMKVLRLIRNGLDHQLDNVTVKNFELQPDSPVLSPTMELNHKEGKMERVSLSVFLPSMFKQLVSIIEGLAIFLAAKKVNPMGQLEFGVRKIPAAQRCNKFVRYSFWSSLGNGFYHQ
jgi:hypothetical protein